MSHRSRPVKIGECEGCESETLFYADTGECIICSRKMEESE